MPIHRDHTADAGQLTPLQKRHWSMDALVNFGRAVSGGPTISLTAIAFRHSLQDPQDFHLWQNVGLRNSALNTQ